MTVIDRFLKLVSYPTTSDERSQTCPSTPQQRVLAEELVRQMQELGIYPGQIPVLGLVSGRDGLSQREIAKILHIKPPTVNVSIQRLEKAGFLYKKPDEKDQRVTRIYMTEKGKEIKAKALERIHKNEAVMMEGFSEAEQCLLRRFLEQILANIEKIQPEEFTGKTPMEEITEKEEQKRD